MSNFTERLNELIKDSGLSVHAFAQEINIPTSVVSNWTKREYNVTLTNLVKIADHFDCSIDYLVGRSDNIEKCGFKKTPEFAKQLRKFIDEDPKKRSIYDICKHTSLAWTCFSDWFHGKIPRLSSLKQLAEYYSCPIDALVGRE